MDALEARRARRRLWGADQVALKEQGESSWTGCRSRDPCLEAAIRQQAEITELVLDRRRIVAQSETRRQAIEHRIEARGERLVARSARLQGPAYGEDGREPMHDILPAPNRCQPSRT